MSCRENAVSEIVSFLLILAVIAAGIGIYATIIEPELIKAEEHRNFEHAAAEFISLKSVIDRLWVLGSPKATSGNLLPLTSADRMFAGTLSFGKGTPIRFNHTGGQTTASLLRLEYIPKNPQNTLTYEGGAVFSNTGIILPAVTGDTNAVLICTEQEDDAILANTMVAVTAVIEKKEAFHGIENLQIADAKNFSYWQENLADVTDLTIVYCSVSLRAVP